MMQWKRGTSAWAAMLAVVLCGSCGNNPAPVHRASGTFSYWPHGEDDVFRLGGEQSDCTSKLLDDDGRYAGYGRYTLRIDCGNWIRGYWKLPADEERVARFPIGEEVPRFPSSFGYTGTWDPQAGEVVYTNYGDAWAERCLSSLREDVYSGTFERRQIDGEPALDYFTPLAGTLRVEAPRECLRGEIDLEINVSR